MLFRSVGIWKGATVRTGVLPGTTGVLSHCVPVTPHREVGYEPFCFTLPHGCVSTNRSSLVRIRIIGLRRRMPTIRITRGMSISTMATTTETIRTTTNMFVSCAAERDVEDLFSFRSLWQAYRSCRRRKRGSANAQRYEVHLLDHLVETLKALQSRQYAPSRSLKKKKEEIKVERRK